jgi:hypothetical protein
MKKIIRLGFLLATAFCLCGVIVRHDVADNEFIALANHYPQICHLPMGEGTLIDSSWVLTAGHSEETQRRAGMESSSTIAESANMLIGFRK